LSVINTSSPISRVKGSVKGSEPFSQQTVELTTQADEKRALTPLQYFSQQTVELTTQADEKRALTPLQFDPFTQADEKRALTPLQHTLQRVSKFHPPNGDTNEFL